MTRDTAPAIVHLRMSPQLRDGLRATAEAAGCSMNAFAVQVLATSVGDPARFRQPPAPKLDLRTIARDTRGFPLDWKQRDLHRTARTVFKEVTEREEPDGWMALITKYDAEDPAHYVEWYLQRIEAEKTTVTQR